MNRRLRILAFALVTIALAIPLLAFPLPAQEQAPAAANTASQSGSQETGKQGDPRETGREDQIAPRNDRLFGVIPNYTTVENEDRFSPLSTRGKFKLALDSSIDPYTFPFIGFIALVGQAENSEPSYGQGMAGYAKRYGTSYGDAIIGTFMTTAILPSALHQDPRYYQLGEGRIAYRTYYAVSRIFVTRTDSKHNQFNLSEIGGNAMAAGMSNLYHPSQDRTFANTMSVWGTDIMWDTASNVAKEFWPDIRRKLTHKPQGADGTP